MNLEKEIRKGWRKNRVKGMLAGRPLVGPQTVHFDIANACNTRCTTCWDHSPLLVASRVPSALWKRKQLPLERFKATLDALLELGGLEYIILSGMGEPLLNPGIYDMISYAHESNIHVTVITNLLLLDQERVFASKGGLQFLTSINGVTKPVWNDFHQHPRKDGWENFNETA